MSAALERHLPERSLVVDVDAIAASVHRAVVAVRYICFRRQTSVCAEAGMPRNGLDHLPESGHGFAVTPSARILQHGLWCSGQSQIYVCSTYCDLDPVCCTVSDDGRRSIVASRPSGELPPLKHDGHFVRCSLSSRRGGSNASTRKILWSLDAVRRGTKAPSRSASASWNQFSRDKPAIYP